MEKILKDSERLYKLHEWLRPLEKSKLAMVKKKIIKALEITNSTYYDYYSRRISQKDTIPISRVQKIVEIVKLHRPYAEDITIENFLNKKASCSAKKLGSNIM